MSIKSKVLQVGTRNSSIQSRTEVRENHINTGNIKHIMSS